MFLGHIAVALGAKKAAPRSSLGTLFAAAQFIDLLWPVFLLLGFEHVRIDPGNTATTPLDFYDYPISHSLLGTLVWAIVFGVAYFAVRRYRTGALVVGLCVLSHWLLDLIVHRPDLPLGIGTDAKFGLGLWNWPVATFIVEAGLLVAGILIYLHATTARDRTGAYGFWGLMAVLAMIYLANILGPPPPDTGVVAVAGNATWLFVLWAYWVDAHRKTKERATAT